MTDSIEPGMPLEADEILDAPVVSDVEEAEEEKHTSKTGRRVLAVVLIILILLLCTIGYFLFKLMTPAGAPSSDSLGKMGWVRSIYGFGKAANQLTIPSTAALDTGSGNIWVADPGKFRLVQYAPDGTFVSMISPSTEGTGAGLTRLRAPSKIALDSDGILYVAEPTYDVIRVFNTQGEELGQIGIPGPVSLAVNDDFLVVGTEDGFAILDKEGNPLHIIGTKGKGEDQFDKVNGVAIDENNVIYVVDTFNNRLSAWTADGTRKWLVETGAPGNQQMTGELTFDTTATAKLQVPMGATIDGNNRLVVADMFDFSVNVFDTKDGKFIAKYGRQGFDDGRFFYPSDIDYDPVHDWYVVSDNGAKRAQIITLPGSGGSLIDKARGSLSGPLKACCFPFLLLLLVLIAAFIADRLKKQRKRKNQELAAAAASQASASDDDVAELG